MRRDRGWGDRMRRDAARRDRRESLRSRELMSESMRCVSSSHRARMIVLSGRLHLLLVRWLSVRHGRRKVSKRRGLRRLLINRMELDEWRGFGVLVVVRTIDGRLRVVEKIVGREVTESIRVVQAVQSRQRSIESIHPHSLLLRRLSKILVLSSVDGILLGLVLLMVRVVDAGRRVGGSGVLRRWVLHLEVCRGNMTTRRFEMMLNVASWRYTQRSSVAARVRVAGGALLILDLELSE